MKFLVKCWVIGLILAVAIPTSFAQDGASQLFTVVGDAPVVSAGMTGEDWDGKWLNSGAMIFHEGQYHMFRNGFRTWPGYTNIGYTVSDDGVNWEAVGTDPIFTTDEVEYARILIMATSVLVEDDGTWVMYFYTWNSRRALIGSGAIGRATADNPMGPWIPDDAPILDVGAAGEWDATQVGVPHVLKTDDGYRMYYSGFGEDGSMQVGLALSEDGIRWEKYDDPNTTEAPYAESDPVLYQGEDGDWDDGGVERPRVIETPDGWVMLYRSPQHGTDPARLGLATSEDGIVWEKYGTDAIIAPDSVPNGISLWFFSLLYENDTFYLYLEALVRPNTGLSHIFLLTHDGGFA